MEAVKTITLIRALVIKCRLSLLFLEYADIVNDEQGGFEGVTSAILADRSNLLHYLLKLIEKYSLLILACFVLR